MLKFFIRKMHTLDADLSAHNNAYVDSIVTRENELQDVKEWLGHSTIKTTSDSYGHLDAGRKKKLAEALTSKTTP